jgi:hypothetical protein
VDLVQVFRTSLAAFWQDLGNAISRQALYTA